MSLSELETETNTTTTTTTTGEPATPSEPSSPFGILGTVNNTSLDEFDGISPTTLIKDWDKRLERALMTLMDASPGMVLVDLILGATGGAAHLVNQYRKGELGPSEPTEPR